MLALGIPFGLVLVGIIVGFGIGTLIVGRSTIQITLSNESKFNPKKKPPDKTNLLVQHSKEFQSVVSFGIFVIGGFGLISASFWGGGDFSIRNSKSLGFHPFGVVESTDGDVKLRASIANSKSLGFHPFGVVESTDGYVKLRASIANSKSLGFHPFGVVETTDGNFKPRIPLIFNPLGVIKSTDGFIEPTETFEGADRYSDSPRGSLEVDIPWNNYFGQFDQLADSFNDRNSLQNSGINSICHSDIACSRYRNESLRQPDWSYASGNPERLRRPADWSNAYEVSERLEIARGDDLKIEAIPKYGARFDSAFKNRKVCKDSATEKCGARFDSALPKNRAQFDSALKNRKTCNNSNSASKKSEVYDGTTEYILCCSEKELRRENDIYFTTLRQAFVGENTSTLVNLKRQRNQEYIVVLGISNQLKNIESGGSICWRPFSIRCKLTFPLSNWLIVELSSDGMRVNEGENIQFIGSGAELDSRRTPQFGSGAELSSCHMPQNGSDAELGSCRMPQHDCGAGLDSRHTKRKENFCFKIPPFSSCECTTFCEGDTILDRTFAFQFRLIVASFGHHLKIQASEGERISFDSVPALAPASAPAPP